MDTDEFRNAGCFFPRPAQAGRGIGRGDLSFTRHLTPALSPNFVGGEGENAVAYFYIQSAFHQWLIKLPVVPAAR